MDAVPGAVGNIEGPHDGKLVDDLADVVRFGAGRMVRSDVRRVKPVSGSRLNSSSKAASQLGLGRSTVYREVAAAGLSRSV
jgi:hypothetical protein